MIQNRTIIQNILWTKESFPPKRMERAILENKPSESDICFHLDQVDYHYRQYLIFTDKTLKRVFWELCRGIKQSSLTISAQKEFLNRLDDEVFNPIEKLLHENELYEYLERNKNAMIKIRFKILTLRTQISFTKNKYND